MADEIRPEGMIGVYVPLRRGICGDLADNNGGESMIAIDMALVALMALGLLPAMAICAAEG